MKLWRCWTQSATDDMRRDLAVLRAREKELAALDQSAATVHAKDLRPRKASINVVP